MKRLHAIIKQAFGTSNENEAASFLASACNRMKAMDKRAIETEVAIALKGVNFSRAGESSAQAKTVYKDTPETTSKLRRAEAEAERLRRELSAAEDRRIRGLAELRAELMKHYGDNSQALALCEELRNQNQDLLNSNKNLITTCEELLAQNQTLINALDDSAEEAEGLQMAVDRLKFENEALCTDADLKDREIADLKGELSLVRIQLQAEREEAGNLCKQMDDLGVRQAAHAAQSKEYQRIIEIKNAACDGYRMGIADRDAEIARLKKQIESKDAIQQSTLEAAQDFRRWFDNAAAERDAAAAASEAKAAANIELARENAELKAQIERLKQSGVTGAIFRAFGV